MSIDLSGNEAFLAQAAHVGWGGFLTLALAPHFGFWPAVATVAAFAVVKEAVESLWGVWEPKQPWSSGAIDAAFFFLGILLAGLIGR